MLLTSEFDKYINLTSNRQEENTESDPQKIQETIQNKPEEAQQYFVRALAYLSENKRKKAIEELDLCTGVDTKNVYAFILKAKIMWSLNQVKQGYIEFWKAYEVDPKNPEVIEFFKLCEDKIK